MSEQQNQTTEPPEPQVAPVEADAGPGGSTDEAASREAAKYRRQLREVQAERDGLREQLTTIQRGQAEQLSGLPKGSALWAAGTTLGDLLGEDGQIDAAKVTAAAQATREALGITPPAPSTDGAGKIGTPVTAEDDPDTFTAAFAPRSR